MIKTRKWKLNSILKKIEKQNEFIKLTTQLQSKMLDKENEIQFLKKAFQTTLIEKKNWKAKYFEEQKKCAEFERENQMNAVKCETLCQQLVESKNQTNKNFEKKKNNFNQNC